MRSFAVVLLAAGGLLTWGSNFAEDYVHDELASQNIAFPPAAALEEEGRTDLLQVRRCQASTPALRPRPTPASSTATCKDRRRRRPTPTSATPERAANTAVEEAVTAGAPRHRGRRPCRAEADAITGQRNTLFKGETLRGLLLSAFAWSTVGRIAGIAGIVAFVAAGVMVLLVALGVRHHHKVVTPSGSSTRLRPCPGGAVRKGCPTVASGHHYLREHQVSPLSTLF